MEQILIAFRIYRPAFRVCAVGTPLRQPVCFSDDLRGQFNATFSDFQAFMVNPALTVDDIQVAARNFGGHKPAL